jgi:hypothetical protein
MEGRGGGEAQGVADPKKLSELFLRKIPIFPDIFRRKFPAENSPEFSPEEMYKKSV